MRLYKSEDPELNGVVMAPLWRRLFAAMIDGFLIFAIQVVIALLSVGIYSLFDHQRTGSWKLDYDLNELDPSVLFVILLLLIPYFLYHALLLSFWNGRTPGKNFMLVRVLSKQPGKISFLQALGRTMLQIISAVPVLLGYIAFSVSKKNSSFHDMLAKTVVLSEEVEHRIIRGAQDQTAHH